jgi:aryl-alcohol dehydrogenase-like predicted oxidoreductase
LDYINLGRAGVKVSRLALGLGLRGQSDEAEAQRLIAHALDAGINFIDCANLYSLLDTHKNFGQSESLLGKVLQGRRDQVVVTTKVFARVGPGPNDAGLSRVHILREIERSLARLHTDYVDIYLVHAYYASAPLDETVRALEDVVRSGKARYVGCCNFAAWQVCRGLWIADDLRMTPFACVQNQYSLLERTPEHELFGLIRDQGLGMMAYSPLAIGLLSGVYAPDQPPPAGAYWASKADDFARMMRGPAGKVVAEVHAVARELGKAPEHVALAWVLSHPEVTCAISGADTIAQLDQNLGGVGWTLDPALRDRLDAVSTLPTMWS